MAEDMKCKGCGEQYQVIGGGDGYCYACMMVKVHAGFTRAELSEAFDRVKDQNNWKMPIEAFLSPMPSDHEIQAIDAAIGFYAGGGAKFQVLGTDKLRVWASGYYKVIGA